MQFILHIGRRVIRLNRRNQNNQLNEVDQGTINTTFKSEQKSTWRLNQIDTLQCAKGTRWGSHLNSISNLNEKFSATCLILMDTIYDGTTAS